MTAAAAPGPPMHSSSDQPQHWTVFTLIAFRLAFVYLILYNWQNLFDYATPFSTGPLDDWFQAPVRALCPWVAVNVFHLSGAVTQYHPTGSGDTTLDYIQLFCFCAISFAAAVFWSALDRRRRNYGTMYAWLRVIVRLTLASALLDYGYSKVIDLQMPAPNLSRLTETFGQASPMGLLWTFIGASRPYETFTGLAEMSGGILLLFPRTVTLGACASAGVMLNVVMLNYCYDVPVKLYSSYLLLMSLFLLLPDAVSLFRFFVLRQTTEPRDIRVPVFRRRWLRIAAIALNAAVVASILYNTTWYRYFQNKGYISELERRPALYGVWSVDSVTTIGPNAPLIDSLRWRTVVIDPSLSGPAASGEAFLTTVRFHNDDSVAWDVTGDDKKHHWKMAGRRSRDTGELDYSQPDQQHLVLTGNIDGIGITAQLHRVSSPASFLLTSRGFHWINEDPFNK